MPGLIIQCVIPFLMIQLRRFSHASQKRRRNVTMTNHPSHRATVFPISCEIRKSGHIHVVFILQYILGYREYNSSRTYMVYYTRANNRLEIFGKHYASEIIENWDFDIDPSDIMSR